MTPTFVDTSYLIALAAPGDPMHKRAVGWAPVLSGPLATTEFVMLEIGDGFAKENLRAVAQKIIDNRKINPALEIIPADTSWLARGYHLFCQRSDKDWGLTDCISFEVMHELGNTDALTHDLHFEQAGFHALLRGDPTT